MEISNNLMEGIGGPLCPLRDTEEERRLLQQFREREEAARRQEERLQKTCEELIQIWQPGLESEIAREAEVTRDPQVDKDWHAFRDFCKQYGAESLPAEVGMVLAFLGQARPKDVRRLHRSISSVHRSFFNDPTDDLLVRALVRQARATSKSPSKSPQTTNGKAH
jgi:hypothetical protein